MRYRPNIASLILFFFIASLAQGGSIEEIDSEWLEATARPDQSADDVDSSVVAELIIERTNEFRREEGRDAVEENAQLREAAQYFADYMARTDTYGHTADDRRPSERAAHFEYDYCLVTENIAYQYHSLGFTTEELAQMCVNGWKDSPDHREAMLDRDVMDTGVAVAQSENTNHWYAVQMFGRPRSAAIEFKIANHSEAEVAYTIGNRRFQLPPRYTRTHTRCRESQVEFDFPNNEEAAPTLEATAGSHYVIEQQESQLVVQPR